MFQLNIAQMLKSEAMNSLVQFCVQRSTIFICASCVLYKGNVSDMLVYVLWLFRPFACSGLFVYLHLSLQNALRLQPTLSSCLQNEFTQHSILSPRLQNKLLLQQILFLVL